MANWFYRIDGQETGPVDTSELKRLAASGELSPTDMIRKEGIEAWVPASKAKGLFPSTSSSPPLGKCPKPDKAVACDSNWPIRAGCSR